MRIGAYDYFLLLLLLIIIIYLFIFFIVVGCLDRKDDCDCERIPVVGDGCE